MKDRYFVVAPPEQGFIHYVFSMSVGDCAIVLLLYVDVEINCLKQRFATGERSVASNEKGEWNE